MFGRLKDLTMNRDGSQNLTVTITSDIRELFDKLKDVEIVIDIKKANKRRSYEANNYLWHLCGEIAKASSKFSNDGKEDVYKEAIRKKGEFEPLLVKEEAVPTFVYRWGEKGLGWFVDIMDEYVGPDSEYADFMEIKAALDRIAQSVSNLQLWMEEQIAAGKLIKPED